MIQRTDGIRKNFAAGGAITANSLLKFGSDDNTLVLAAAATDPIVAVSVEAAASGAKFDPQLTGIAEVKLGGTVTRGDDVTSDASGLGVSLSAAATIKCSVGRAMASGVVGDIIPVAIHVWSATTA